MELIFKRKKRPPIDESVKAVISRMVDFAYENVRYSSDEE